VIPLYYARGPLGFSPEWIRMAKRSIMTLLQRFNSQRMVGEYLDRFYKAASHRGQELAAGNYQAARDVAAWKRKVRSAWPHVQVRALSRSERRSAYGDKIRFEAALKLDRLAPEDVEVELLMASPILARQEPQSYILAPAGREGDEQRYALDLAPELCGKLEYRIRAYPRHPSLAHRFEMGLMKWA